MIPKRKIGQTGELVSILGFGSMRLPLVGPKPDQIDRPQAIEMIRRCIDRGINYVDTAYPYHPSVDRNQPGASEPLVAEALSDGYRQKVLLATKLPTWLVKKREDMDRFLDEQLKRLKTSQIDFYLAHNLNASVWDGLVEMGIREFFDEAVRDGRIKYPSFSFHDNYSLFERIVGSYDWAMAQIQYNYLDRDYQAGIAGAELAAKKGIGLVIMEPLRGGFLVDHVPDGPRAIMAKARPDWSLPAWGFNWLWAQKEISVVLSGMSTLGQVLENLAIAESWTDGKFNQADLAAIDQVRAFFESRMKTNCTACGYCMPCSSGVDIPKNLGFLNQYYLFDAQEAKERCHYFYGVQVSQPERAENCVGCRECEEKCPQHITIPDFLAQTAKLYAV
ncbi:MAG: aldo/keto reductase [Deltaproteobacteria bacterium]|jgi:predicted aldo/keto reductase-like oxidoreductase|nr:aldo/keto reductase [Deltaproteobacteria bacterium]